ncbi:MAG TPA: sugar transporter [Geobacter sp.]|nr:sugar transporter [Geobacter sp.]
MPLRSIAVILFVQLLFSSVAVWGSENGAMTVPATQEEAAPAAAEPAASSPPLQAAVPAPDAVAWWREAAGRLGLGPDTNPGESAEPASGRPAQVSEYVIGAGDQLGISVWREEHLSGTVAVLPDGRISFPLVGELVAAGKTVAQLKHELETKLSRFVSEAGVTVEVKQANSMTVFILGRVNAPGRQTMLASTNVLQALAMAGGMNPYARRNDVKVFRQQAGKTVVFPFDYDDVTKGRHLETNIELQRGDVVIVP